MTLICLVSVEYRSMYLRWMYIHVCNINIYECMYITLWENWGARRTQLTLSLRLIFSRYRTTSRPDILRHLTVTTPRKIVTNVLILIIYIFLNIKMLLLHIFFICYALLTCINKFRFQLFIIYLSLKSYTYYNYSY